MIVVAGYTFGDIGDTATDTVEIYDLTTPATTWVTTTSFPEPIIASRGVTLGNIFYVTGRRVEGRGRWRAIFSQFNSRRSVHLGVGPSATDMDRSDVALCQQERARSLCSSRN